jgi:hypothetical protein
MGYRSAKQFREAPCHQAKWATRMGRRILFPVAAKMALTTAGAV